MNEIKNLFEKISAENRALLVAFISCGDPDLKFTEKLIERVCAAGADIIELGVPFSDPMADGPAIQRASARALKSGTTIDGILKMAHNLRGKGITAPFVMFSYYNPIFKRGVEKTARDCRESGVNAWLVVDSPLEESPEILTHTEKFGLDFIALASPTTPKERVAEISKKGSGFLYYIMVKGITGARKSLPDGISGRLEEVREASLLPVAAGFGISTPEMAREAALHSDAVVVGSSLVDLAHKVREAEGEETSLAEAEKFVASISSQMKRD